MSGPTTNGVPMRLRLSFEEMDEIVVVARSITLGIRSVVMMLDPIGLTPNASRICEKTAGLPSPLKPLSFPASVSMMPFGRTSRTRRKPPSVMMKPDPVVVQTPEGAPIPAWVAGPPSPETSRMPFPAAVVTAPTPSTPKTVPMACALKRMIPSAPIAT